MPKNPSAASRRKLGTRNLGIRQFNFGKPSAAVVNVLGRVVCKCQSPRKGSAKRGQRPTTNDNALSHQPGLREWPAAALFVKTHKLANFVGISLTLKSPGAACRIPKANGAFAHVCRRFGRTSRRLWIKSFVCRSSCVLQRFFSSRRQCLKKSILGRR